MLSENIMLIFVDNSLFSIIVGGEKSTQDLIWLFNPSLVSTMGQEIDECGNVWSTANGSIIFGTHT